MTKSITCVSVLACLVALHATSAAPTGARLTGAVEDETGAPIPVVRLTLVRSNPPLTRKTSADKTGQFVFDDVPPGSYLLHVEAPDFQAVDLPVEIGSEMPQPLRVRMKVSLAEEVNVSPAAGDEPVRGYNNANQVKVDESLLSGLPIEAGNPLALASLFLSPASLGDGPSIVVDGLERSGLSVPTAGIRRMIVNLNPYSAEYRRPGSARIEIISQHGSSQHLHGSAALFVRNSAIDARNVFASTKPDLDRRLFQGSVSGPIPNHRMSFFVDAESQRSRETAIVNARTLAGPVVENSPARQDWQSVFGRVDWHPNQVQFFALRYDFSGESGKGAGIGGLRLPEQGVQTSRAEHEVQASLQSAFSSLLSELRLIFDRTLDSRGVPPIGPAIVVHGAFTGGPAQVFRSDRDRMMQAQYTVTVFYGRHTVRFGGVGRHQTIGATDASNFGGAFEFSSLARWAAKAPFVFRVNQGRPAFTFTQPELVGFVQDEILPHPDLSVTLGLRYDWQSALDKGAFGPRAAFGWSPRAGKTIIRGGAGVFHERLPGSVIRRERLYGDAGIREVVVTDPSYPNALAGADVQSLLPSTVRIAPDVVAPSLIQATLGVERELWPRTNVGVEYRMLRGWHLFRSRNINLPDPSTGLRPDASFLNVTQVESSAMSRGHALDVTFRGRFAGRFKGNAQYTLSRTTDDTSGPLALPADSRYLAAERGRADNDRRHRLALAGTIDITRTLRVGLVANLASGAPFDITTGFDDNGDTVANDRPLGVTRNTGDGPPMAQFDLRVTKLVSVWRPFDRPDRSAESMTINLDLFNVLNRTNYSGFVGIVSSPFFGRAVSAGPPRTMQLSVRYRF